jgi:hypothetical protein
MYISCSETSPYWTIFFPSKLSESTHFKEKGVLKLKLHYLRSSRLSLLEVLIELGCACVCL